MSYVAEEDEKETTSKGETKIENERISGHGKVEDPKSKEPTHNLFGFIRETEIYFRDKKVAIRRLPFFFNRFKMIIN